MTAFFRILFLCFVLLFTTGCGSLLSPFFPNSADADKKNAQIPLKPFTFSDWAYLADSSGLEWFYDPASLKQSAEGVISLEVITKAKGLPWPKIGILPNAKVDGLDAIPVGISHPANPPEIIEVIVEPKLDPKLEQKLSPPADMGSSQMAEKTVDLKLDPKLVKKVVPIIFLQPALIEIDCTLNVFKAQISEVYAPSIPFMPVIPGEKPQLPPKTPAISSLSDIGVSKGEWKDIKGNTAMHWVKTRLCGRTVFGNLTRYYFLYQDPPIIKPPLPDVKLAPVKVPVPIKPVPLPPPIVFDILYKQILIDAKNGNKEMRLISYKLDKLLSDETLWSYRADCQNEKYQMNKLGDKVAGEWQIIGSAISLSGVAFNRACGNHGDYMNTVNEFTK
ncbi:MAG: hypothetical protein NT054_03855 [Burkholderiales bacterium]|nr:hypothetical protein [Burkholderiales bacterium]